MADNKKDRIDDNFSKLMFGDKWRRDDSDISSHVNEEENNSINYEELFNQLDIIVDYASKLKPLMSKVTPLIEKHFLKKK